MHGLYRAECDTKKTKPWMWHTRPVFGPPCPVGTSSGFVILIRFFELCIFAKRAIAARENILELFPVEGVP